MELHVALASLSSADTAPQTRRLAHDTIEQFKQQAPLDEILRVASLQLQASTDDNPFNVQFGLHILEEAVLKDRWMTLSADQRLVVRSLVTSYLTQGPPKIFRRKACGLVSGLAQRCWPQEWPDFLEQVISFNGLIACEAISALSEDVFEFNDHIQSRRRQELAKCLIAALEPLILPFLLEFLSRAAAESTSIAHLEAGVLLLRAIAPWASVKVLFAHGIPRATLQLLGQSWFAGNETITTILLNVIETLVARKDPASKECDSLWAQYFSADVIGLTIKIIQAQDIEKYADQKRLVDILKTIGTNHLTALQENAEALLGYLQLMTDLVSHPSWVIRHSTTVFWNGWFRTSSASSIEFKTVSQKWLSAAVLGMVSVGNPETDDSSSCKYTRVDFDSAADYRSFYLQTRAKFLTIFRCAGSLEPAFSLRLGFEKLDDIVYILERYPFPEDQADPWGSLICPTVQGWSLNRGYIGPMGRDGALGLLSETILDFLECVVPEARMDKDLLESLSPAMIALQGRILNFPNASAVHECVKYQGLRIFQPLFEFRADLLQHTLKTLFDVFQATVGSNVAEKRASEMHRMSATSLVYIAQHLKGPSVTSIVNPLRDYISGLLATGTLSTFGKSSLYQVLSLVSNEIESQTERANFIESTVESGVVLLECAELKTAFERPSNFLDFFGMRAPACAEANSRRERVLDVVLMLEVVARHLKVKQGDENPLLRGVYPRCLPAIFKIFRCLAELAKPENEQLVSAMSSESILFPSSREVAFLLGVDGSGVTVLSADDTLAQLGYRYAPDPLYAGERHFVNSLRSQVQDVIRCSVRSGVHTNPKIFKEIIATAEIAEFESWGFYQVVRGIICAVLDTRINPFILPSVKECLRYLASFLSRLTRILRQAFGSPEASENDVLGLAREQAARLLARACSDIILVLAPPPDESVPTNSPVVELGGFSEVGDLLLSDEGAADAVLVLAETILVLPDSKASYLVASIFLRVLPDLAKKRKAFLYDRLLVASLQVMVSPSLVVCDNLAVSIILECLLMDRKSCLTALRYHLSKFPAAVAGLNELETNASSSKRETRIQLKSFLENSLDMRPGSRPSDRKATHVFAPPGKVTLKKSEKPSNHDLLAAREDAALDLFFGL